MASPIWLFVDCLATDCQILFVLRDVIPSVMRCLLKGLGLASFNSQEGCDEPVSRHP